MTGIFLAILKGFKFIWSLILEYPRVFLTLAIVGYTLFYINGLRDVNANLTTENTSLKAQIADRDEKSKQIARKNEEEHARQEKNARDKESSYNESIKELKANYEKHPNIKHLSCRVQDNGSSGDGMPAPSSSSGSVDKKTDGIDEAIATEPSREIQIDDKELLREIVQFLELIRFNKKVTD